MVAFHSRLEDPFPRNPFEIADELRHALRTRAPGRFEHANVRVANGAVALTGCVPNWQSKSLAIRLARQAFGETTIIDALEIRDRRTFGSAA